MVGIYEKELQNKLFTKSDLTSIEAEKMAVIAETAKNSKEAMSSDAASAF